MNKTHKTFIFLGIALLVLGTLAKLNHWKYASELFLFGMVYFVVFATFTLIKTQQKKKK